MRFEDVRVQDLGIADRINSTKNSTVIVGGNGEKKEINKRVALIKKQIGTTESLFEKEKMRERLARLSGGVAVIKVGGQTEVEMKERKERVIDAVAATQAAIEDGIVHPSKVLKQAICNAVSVAVQLMSINAVIITQPDKNALPRLRS